MASESSPPAVSVLAGIDDATFRSGFVTLLGRPNAGKSTLLNTLVGSKVAIVTPHPQTTRTHLVGVLNLPPAGRFGGGQIALVDTPGVHRGRSRLHHEMMRSVQEGLAGRDAALLLVDATRRFGAEDELALSMLRSGAEAQAAPPAILALNKIDRFPDRSRLLPLLDEWSRKAEFADLVPISAQTGENLPALVTAMWRRLPAGPEYFPSGQVSDQPERFWISEVIREQAMLLTREEVPHALAVRLERDESAGGLRTLSAVLICERPGQKAILVGRGGEMIRRIGTQARKHLEAALKTRIFLELHVLLRPEWREQARWMKEVDWHQGGGE